MTRREMLLLLLVLAAVLVLLPPLGNLLSHDHRCADSQLKLTNLAKARLVAFQGRFAGHDIRHGAWSPAQPDQAAGIADFAAVLAMRTYFDMASQWYVEGDAANAGADAWWDDGGQPDLAKAPAVLLGKGDARVVNPRMHAPGPRDGRIAWTTYAPMSADDTDPTVPVIWTRGLNTDGTWSEDGVLGARQGGHIAFADGHVEVHGFGIKPDREGLFVDRVTPGARTNDWRRAVGTRLPGGDWRPFDGSELRSR